MSQKPFRSAIAGFFLLAIAVSSAVAQSSSDACSLLTQAQVSTALGAQVSAGAWNSPDFKTTCTWTAPDIIVTLSNEGLNMFNAARTPPIPTLQVVPVGGVGDTAFYVVTGNMVSLHMKKGGAAFKTSVYCSKFSVAKLESVETTLAQEAASKL